MPILSSNHSVWLTYLVTTSISTVHWKEQVCQRLSSKRDIFPDVVNINLSDKVVLIVLDAGSGHASATCSGGVLHLRLQNTKRIRDVTKIQYAARLKTRWAARDHPMSSCDVNKCRLTDGGKTLEVDVPNAHGKNYIVN